MSDKCPSARRRLRTSLQAVVYVDKTSVHAFLLHSGYLVRSFPKSHQALISCQHKRVKTNFFLIHAGFRGKSVLFFSTASENMCRMHISQNRLMENKDITMLLQQGDAQSLEELFPIVYSELRRIAAVLFNNEYRANHTLQPTALVHEAYLRLVGSGQQEISWQSRAHFFGIAARSMRQILVNHAEANNAQKRAGGHTIVELDEAISFFQTQNIEILALHEALEKIAVLDKRQAEVVELKFFGGLTIEEIAEVLNISSMTVRRDWETAKLWLRHALK